MSNTVTQAMDVAEVVRTLGEELTTSALRERDEDNLVVEAAIVLRYKGHGLRVTFMVEPKDTPRLDHHRCKELFAEAIAHIDSAVAHPQNAAFFRSN